MSIQTPTVRAVQIALALELAWAVFIAYETHHYQFTGGWQLQIVNFGTEWAHAAVAIVVVTWLVDVAVAQHRRGRSEAA